METVKAQYERYPYPPVPFLALPKRGQGLSLAYEAGMAKAGVKGDILHRNKRILVAGAGTLEALVVAQMHPHAKEVVAVDLSVKSIKSSQRRVAWSRVNDIFRLRWSKKLGRLPPIRFEVADLNQWQDTQPFDYIVASNMLHHVDRPAFLLARLASWLTADGLLRVMTYPKQSRFWLRYVGQWLRLSGIDQNTSNIKQAAREAIFQLPVEHPIRQCYVRHSETKRPHGIVDAFLHVCENPLSPLEWQSAVEASGLRLLGEEQNYLSSSAWLSELVPQLGELTSWQRLQVLDDLLELTSNPILWLQKNSCSSKVISTPSFNLFDNTVDECEQDEDVLTKANCSKVSSQHFIGHYRLPSLCFWQLKQGLLRVEAQLHEVGVSVSDVIKAIQGAVDRDDSVLSIGAYSLEQIRQACEPCGLAFWDSVKGASIHYNGVRVPGDTSAEQVHWLQIRYGPVSPLLDIEVVN